MQADTGANNQPSNQQESEPYFGARDMIFVVIALIVAVLVIQLGYHTWSDGSNTEMTKSQGEDIAAWMTEQGAKRATGESTGLPACDRGEGNWLACRDAMVAEGGPFAGLGNHFDAKNVVFSPVCDRSQLNTHGAIMMEKGTPKPPDGASLLYSPLADDEPLADVLSLRVSICGRGFSTIHIAEFKF